MALMTEDSVCEDTHPLPTGCCHEEQAAFRAVWVDLFQRSHHARFEMENISSAGYRCRATLVRQLRDVSPPISKPDEVLFLKNLRT